MGEAEALGFDHVWTYDHLAWRSLADQPWGGTIPTLTAAASVTSTIRLGTFVASPNFRHPVPFAKELSTLDDISGGRLILGLGSGGTGVDASVLGQAPLTPGDRHDRFVEFVDALDVLLRFEEPGSGGISFAGRWYAAEQARMVGRPEQEPRMPFAIAANGRRGLRLVARVGRAWMTTGPRDVALDEWWRSVGRLSTRLDDILGETGRAPADVDRYLSLDASGVYSLSSPSAFADAAQRADELGFTDVVVHWPRGHGPYEGDERLLARIMSSY